MLGRVLIVGGRAAQVAERLEARGFSCARAASVDLLPAGSADAVVFAGSVKDAGPAVAAIRSQPALRQLPIVVDGSRAPRSFGGLDVEAVAPTIDELERHLAASLKARQLAGRDELVRKRLELLLDISRQVATATPLGGLCRAVARQLEVVLSCDEVAVLHFDPGVPRRARLTGSRGRQTPVDLAVSPTLRQALEQRSELFSEGLWVFPFPDGHEAPAALVARRSQSFEQEERDFLTAVGVALTQAAERAATHDAMSSARTALEGAYLDRYRELQEANERLKALDRKKDELLAVLSHDLRAPLNILIGHAHLLVTDAQLGESARGSAEVMQRTARKVLELIERLLDQSRSQEERTVLLTRTFDVAEACQQAVRNLQILAQKRGVALRAEAPMSLVVQGDEQKIDQVLQNLITNALTHARGATEVVVRSRLKSRPDGDVALVEVRDNGVVEDESELLLAFERSRGLGLAIARNYVDSHRGEIWAEAPRSGGALFAFTLPIRTQQSQPSSPGPAGAAAVPLVLIAEDDPVFLRVASMGLSGHFRVETARDGEQALEKARALRPDVIVMNVFMPRRDGLDTLRELKLGPHTAGIPVVLVTSNPELTEKIRTLEVGAADHLTKPFPLSVLVTRVTEALQRVSPTRSGPGNDPETGLFDHLGIVNRLGHELSRSTRYERPLSLAVLKPQAPPGRDRIRSAASLVRSALRAPDVVGHLGGGVFALVLPETPGGAARSLLDRLLEELGAHHGVAYTARLVDVRDPTAGPDALVEQALA